MYCNTQVIQMMRKGLFVGTFTPIAGIGQLLYADASALIGGYDSGGAYAAQIASDQTVNPLSLTLGSNSEINSVAINSFGDGLIGGINSNAAYAAQIASDQTVNPLSLGLVSTSEIYSVAINSSGDGLIGGVTMGCGLRAYAARVSSAGIVASLNLSSLIGGSAINSVAINSSGDGIIGGLDPNGVMAYAATVASGGATSLNLNLGINSEIDSVAINSSGDCLIGGMWHTTCDTSAPYAAFVSSGVVTSLSLGPSAGDINSVAINDSGKGIIGGNYTNVPYAALVQLGSATVQSLGLSSLGAINSVAINSSGTGLIGGYDSNGAYAAMVASDSTVATSLGLNLGSGSEINSVAINSAGVGLIGGLASGEAYAALVAPNRVVTPLSLGLGSGSEINSVALEGNIIFNTVTPQSIGPYSSAINSQLAVSAALETRFITQSRAWVQHGRSNELAEFAYAEQKNTMKSQVSPKQPANTFWLAPFGNYTHLKAQGEIPSFTNEIAGVFAAYDHAFSNFLVGGGMGYAFNYVHYSDSLGHGKIHEETACLYGSYEQDRFWIDAAFWGGLYQFHNERHSLPSITSTAHSHGWIFTPHIEIAAPRAIDTDQKYFAEPFIMFDWVNSWQHHFTESGASGFNLVMDSQYASLLQSECGLRFYEQFQYTWGKFLLEEKLSYINQAPFHFHNVNTFFIGSASSFSVATGSSRMQSLGGVQLLSTFLPCNHAYPYGTLTLQGAFGSSYQSYFVCLDIGKKF